MQAHMRPKSAIAILASFIMVSCSGSDHMVQVPDGTMLTVALTQPLSTEANKDGDSFSASVVDDVTVDGKTVIKRGETVTGRLSDVKPANKVGGDAFMTLDFQKLVAPDGRSYQLHCQPITLQGKATTESEIEKVLGGTVAGAVIGGIVKGGSGALVGAAVGAGAGGVFAIATKGKNIELPDGQKFAVTFTESTSLPAVTR